MTFHGGCCTKRSEKLWNLTGGRRIAIHRSDEARAPFPGHLSPPEHGSSHHRSTHRICGWFVRQPPCTAAVEPPAGMTLGSGRGLLTRDGRLPAPSARSPDRTPAVPRLVQGGSHTPTAWRTTIASRPGSSTAASGSQGAAQPPMPTTPPRRSNCRQVAIPTGARMRLPPLRNAEPTRVPFVLWSRASATDR